MIQRQFHRLVEMLIQLHLNPADARGAKAYRLQVKERLYRFNYVSAGYSTADVFTRSDLAG